MSLKHKVKFDENIIFYDACTKNDFEEARDQIKAGVDINYQNLEGLTALHNVCISGRIEMCRYLIENGANIDCKDNEGWTPLHIAASMNNLKLTQFLIKSGASLSIINYDLDFPVELSTDSEVINFLETQMEENGINRELIKDSEHLLMLKHANIDLFENVIDPKTGVSALHVAAAKNYVDVLRNIIKLPIDVNQTDFDGWTALHVGAYFNNQEVCELLIKSGANQYALTKYKETPIDLASIELKNYIKTLSNQILDIDSIKMSENNDLNKSKLKDYSNSADETLENVNVMPSKDDSGPGSYSIPINVNDDFNISKDVTSNELVKIEKSDKKNKSSQSLDSLESTELSEEYSKSLEEGPKKKTKKCYKALSTRRATGIVDSNKIMISSETSIQGSESNSSETLENPKESPKKKNKKSYKPLSSRRVTSGVELKDISKPESTIQELERILSESSEKNNDDSETFSSGLLTDGIEIKQNLSTFTSIGEPLDDKRSLKQEHIESENIKQSGLSTQKLMFFPETHRIYDENPSSDEKNLSQSENKFNPDDSVNNSIPYRIRNSDKNLEQIMNIKFCDNCIKIYADLMLARIENSKLRRNIDCANLKNFIISNYNTLSDDAIQNITNSLKRICHQEENKHIMINDCLDINK